MKFRGYYHRALKARDQRYRRVYEKMGYGRRDMRVAEQDEMAELRAEYQRVVGKRPYMGWDADTLREKMAEVISAEAE